MSKEDHFIYACEYICTRVKTDKSMCIIKSTNEKVGMALFLDRDRNCEIKTVLKIVL